MWSASTVVKGSSSGLDPSTLAQSSGTSVAGDANTSVDGYTRFAGSLSPSVDNFAEEKIESDKDDQSLSSSCMESLSSSCMELMFSLYLPMIIVWTRRCMFGTANFVHSLVMGHCLRLLIENCSGWTPLWLQTIVLRYQVANGKMDPHAWPPPAFRVLALLTMFALVVHPDGFTWVLLDKVRDIASSTCHSTTRYWKLLVKDYGVITTVAALMTLKALVFLLFVIFKTLAPRRRPNRVSASPEKKKKKRRGHARHRGNGGGGRIKTPSNSNGTGKGANTTKSREAPCSSDKTTRDDKFTISSTPIPSEDSFPSSVPSEKNNISMHNDIAPSSVPGREEMNEKGKERKRLSSVSSIATTSLSDDLSCGSASVRSLPSMNTTSTRTKGGELDTHSVKGKSPSASSRQQKRGGRPPNKEHNSGQGNVKSSRWDALKPNQNVVHNHNQYNHQQLQYHNNGNNHYRQKRRGGGKGHRNGGPQQQSSSSPPSPPHYSSPRLETHTPDFTLAAVKSDISTAPPQFPSNKLIDESRSLLGKVPPPPPGLGPFSIATRIVGTQTTTRSSELISLPSLPPKFQRDVENSDAYSRQQDSPVLSSSFASNSCENREWQTSTPGVDQFLPHASPFASQFVTQQHSSYGNVVKENPFADSCDSKIEAEMQELGGQMAGSILDF